MSYISILTFSCYRIATECCKALLEDWLSSDRGVKPKTWKNLLKAIGEVEELQPVLDEIKHGLQSGGITFEGVCVCACVRAYLRAYVCACIVCIYVCVCVCVCVCVHLYMYVYIQVFACICVYACVLVVCVGVRVCLGA